MRKKGFKRSFIISFIVGLIIFFFIFNLAAGAQEAKPLVPGGLVPCGNGEAGPDDCDFQKLLVLVNKILTFLVTISSFIFVIIVVYAGLLYITASGNPGKISLAHKLFFNAIIGIIIVVSAWLIIKMLLTSLDANNKNILAIMDLLWIG